MFNSKRSVFFVILLYAGLIMIGCGTESENGQPFLPTDPEPGHDLFNVVINIDLTWECFDPDDDPLTFDVYFGEVTDPPTDPLLEVSGQTGTTYSPGTLDIWTAYNWKVVASDDHGFSTPGQLWSFTTGGPLVNQPPEQPSEPFPGDNASIVPTFVTLAWIGIDPDRDPVTYDLYFGDSNPPPLVTGSLTDTSYTPENLDYGTVYYWKIVSKDDQGHETEGQVWSFTTAQAPGMERSFDLGTTGLAIEMIWIAPGIFQMGSEEGELDSELKEYPLHEITLNYGFWLGKYEVTQDLWEAVMDTNPSYIVGDSLPVEKVSWDDVHDFLDALNNQTAASPWRLPSEAEWEFACRAGTQTRFPWGDDEGYAELGSYGWYELNSNRQTGAVGQLSPNPWGLYDMFGNVQEWCEDRYHNDYGIHWGGDTAPLDGSAWVTGDSPKRMMRGGSYRSQGRHCRPAKRIHKESVDQNIVYGFRVVHE